MAKNLIVDLIQARCAKIRAAIFFYKTSSQILFQAIICRVYSRNLWHCWLLARKGTFLWKRAPFWKKAFQFLF